MNINQLCEMYVDLKKKSDKDPALNFEDELFKMYDENIAVIPVPSSDKLAIVRTVLDGSIKKIGEYEYVDEGLEKITLDIIIVQRLTDIDFENNGGDETSASKYDKIKMARIKEYLWSRYYSEMDDFESFEIAEEATIRNRNTEAAIMEKRRVLKDEENKSED